MPGNISKKNWVRSCWLLTILLAVTSCAPEQYKDICSLDKAHIPFHTAIRARAVIVTYANWYSLALSGKNCIRDISFELHDPLPKELADRVNEAVKKTVGGSQLFVVEADVIFEAEKIEYYGNKFKNPMTGIARIKGAKNFKLVPFSSKYGEELGSE